MTIKDTTEVEEKLRAAGKLALMLREGKEASSTQSRVPLSDPVEVVAEATTCSVNCEELHEIGV